MKTKKIIIALSVFIVLLSAGVITLGVLYGKKSDETKVSSAILENHYQQAYYTLLDETNDMEIKLAKLSLSTGTKTQSELLRDISKSSEVAANAMSALSSADVSLEYTMKFVNQTGDFAKYLTELIADGEPLSAEHKESLKKIHSMFVRLGTELAKVQDSINDGNLFIDSAKNATNTLSDIFTGLNEASVEYPQLIYDGPFSDSLNDKETKGLSGNDIDEARGREIIEEIFGDVGVSYITFSGEWQADIPTLNFEAKVNGTDATVQLAKQGGSLLSYNAMREVTEPNLTPVECAEKGLTFLTDLGYTNMQAVWLCNDNSTVFVNFAPVVDGVIIYPDLIKIKVAADNGEILGAEARSYAFNHTTRTLSSPSLSEPQAKAKLSVSENVSVGKLCLIPYKTNREVLCYEFVVEENGTYYIYIDAVTGDEINILYVISTTGGDKLV